MKKNRIYMMVVLLSFMSLLGAESPFYEPSNEGYKQSIGSTLFLLGNFAPGDPPYFGQINYGYHLSPHDILFLEAITWTYYEPLGTYDNSKEFYPGKVRSLGLGVGYQRFLWKGFYTSLMAAPFLQLFYDEEDEYIQSGFQLYLQLRLGYRFEFFDHRWFIEPSAAFNYWPVNANFPETFQDIEENNDAPNYYLLEPGLHFGYKF